MTNDELMTKPESTIEHSGSSWSNGEPSSIGEEPETTIYDLEERMARFGEAVRDFAKRIPRSPLTDRIISQLVGTRTSVGANYSEGDDSVPKKEFLESIGTFKKESRETKYFLPMAVRAVPALKDEARKLWMEARALHLIFAKIWRGGKGKERPC